MATKKIVNPVTEKKAVAVETVKTAPVKKEEAVKVETVKKAEPVKAEAVKKAEPVKAETVKKAEPAKKAAPAKKAVAKKATAKKAEVKSEITVQFDGKSYTQEDLVKIAQDVWKYDLEQKEEDLKSVELYVKPGESAAYYVMNKEFTGSFYI